MSPPIILLNGWPGVGKDTVAETLKLLLGDDKACLVDWSNESQAQTFQQAIPEQHDVAGQKAKRDVPFAAQVEHPSLRNRIVISTDCLPDTAEGRRLAHGFEVAANRSGRLLMPVYVDCGLDENMRRIVNAERRVNLKTKIRSPNEAHTVRSQGGKLFIYPRLESLTVDVTRMMPHEAALQILTFMRELVERRDDALAHDEETPMERREPVWS